MLDPRIREDDIGNRLRRKLFLFWIPAPRSGSRTSFAGMTLVVGVAIGAYGVVDGLRLALRVRRTIGGHGIGVGMIIWGFSLSVGLRFPRRVMAPRNDDWAVMTNCCFCNENQL